nr:hypothetical protein [Tanacetum cinerariifolium]
MADERTMAELLRAPTEGYAEAILVPPILSKHFELKHSLINIMTSDQFFELEKDNPHDHIRCPSLARKRTPRSILTWEDFVSKFLNEFFPPSRTTNLRNEISNFQQRFDESFHDAWDRYKDLLPACPHHGFTELHQLDTFYNALNPTDQDSLNSAAGGNLLERRTQDVLTIIENKSKQTSAVTTAMTAILKQFQATPPPASVKAIKEICVTCGAAVNYNQVVPLSELEKIKKINEVNIKAMQAQINNVKNKLRNEMKTLIQASMSNQTNELKNMMASFFQMNTASTSGSEPLPSNTIAKSKGKLKAITTRRGLVLNGPSIPMPLRFINLEEDERTEETFTDPELAEYTIKVSPPLVQKAKPPSLRNYVKLPEKRGDPGKFLIPCGFSKLKCKALADVAGIARDVFVSVGKFTFLANFFIVNYESDPRVPLILGRPFLRTAHALINVHGEEMILCDGDERLTLNTRHDTSSYSNQPHKESINMINIYNDSYKDY